MPRGIFCIEGLWEQDLRKTSTVQPILSLLKQNEKIPFIYRDCAVKKEFLYYISKFPVYRNFPILYLAMHGDNGTVRIRSGSRKATELTISEVGDFLKGKCSRKIIIFGSCGTLNVDKRIIKSFINKTSALAVCGYKNDVDWMISTAFELLLLSVLQNGCFDGRGIISIFNRCVDLANRFKTSNEDNIQFRMVHKFE